MERMCFDSDEISSVGLMESFNSWGKGSVIELIYLLVEAMNWLTMISNCPISGLLIKVYLKMDPIV